jgi:hypothetical protein
MSPRRPGPFAVDRALRRGTGGAEGVDGPQARPPRRTAIKHGARYSRVSDTILFTIRYHPKRKNRPPAYPSSASTVEKYTKHLHSGTRFSSRQDFRIRHLGAPAPRRRPFTDGMHLPSRRRKTTERDQLVKERVQLESVYRVVYSQVHVGECDNYERCPSQAVYRSFCCELRRCPYRHGF